MRVSAVAGFAFLILSGCGAAQLPDPIAYESRGQSFVVTVDLGEDPTLAGQWLPDGAVTAEQAAFRAAWKSAIGG